MKKRAIGKVERLGAKKTVGDMLAAGKTYAEISAQVEKETGSKLTEMSICRFQKSWAEKARALEDAAQEAVAIMEFIRQHPEADLAGAGMALMLKGLVRRFSDIEGIFDGADGVDMGNLLLRTARVGQTAEALDLMRERLEISKKKAVKVADEVKETMTRSGVSGEEISAAVNKILGVTE